MKLAAMLKTFKRCKASSLRDRNVVVLRLQICSSLVQKARDVREFSNMKVG